MKPLSFIIVGSGWRSLFYARIAKRYPEQFQLKYMLCRSGEKADMMAAEHGVPTTVSMEACEEAKPDFVVIAVSKSAIFTETKRWALKGYPVLCETPAALNEAELKELWEMVQKGAKIQVAEQYHRYPTMAAGLKAIAEGKLDEPYAVTLSVAHDYHGVSLIRHMLAPKQPEALRLEYMTGRNYTFPVRETDSRSGAVTDGSVKERERTLITMHFEGGKEAFYDFGGIQYRSYIRSRHVNVQGRDGEWNDVWLRYVNEYFQPIEEKLLPWLNPEYADLNTPELLKESGEWTGRLSMSQTQDEYAIATMMYDMQAYIEKGREVYPIAEALEDAYLYLLMQKSVREPDTKVFPELMPWQKQGT